MAIGRSERDNISKVILSRRYIPLEDKVFIRIAIVVTLTQFLTFWTILTRTQPPARQETVIAERWNPTTQSLMHDDSNSVRPQAMPELVKGKEYKIILLNLGILAFVLAAIRVVLRRNIFSKLDNLVHITFTRRVFEATGGVFCDESGRVYDGRLHFFHSFVNRIRQLLMPFFVKPAKEAISPRIQSRKGISIVRQPEAPRLRLENFSNDELGQLAVALNEKEEKYLGIETSLQAMVDALPYPAMTIASDGSLFHVNQIFRESINRIHGLQNATNSSFNFRDVLTETFGFPENLSRLTENVLQQIGPRITGHEVTLKTCSGLKKFSVSVSAIPRQGKRAALILLHELQQTSYSRLDDLITDLALQQLDSVERILSARHGESNDAPFTIACDALKDQINTLLELSNTISRDMGREVIPFNLQTLLNSIRSHFSENYAIEIEMDNGTPCCITGNPSHLRQIILSTLHAFFAINTGCVVIKANFDNIKGIMEIVFAASSSTPIVNAGRMNSLSQIASFYKYDVINRNSLIGNVFFGFRFNTETPPDQARSFLPALLESIQNKRILLAHFGSTLPEEISSIAERINCTEMKIIKFSKNLGKISVQKNFDACILFADEQPWSKNPALKKVLEILHKSATPVLLIPSISRRGDSAEAFRLGISGYLRTPFSTEELVSILTLLCAKESRFLLKAKGIITRHIVQELAHPVGLALVASFSESSEVYAEQLNDILGKIGLRVKRTRSQKEFFEELFSSSVNFIFFPAELSFGLQRQVGVALKGQSHITVRYRTDARGKDECKTSTPDELMIQNTNNFSEVLQILQRANLSHDITHRPTQRRRAS